ncbi:hypothetical protein HED50_17725 [Ochrobactrum oryzae]|nr:hypothetical protein [Brucella oryzae]
MLRDPAAQLLLSAFTEGSSSFILASPENCPQDKSEIMSIAIGAVEERRGEILATGRKK